MTRMRIDDLGDRQIHQMSGGQRQRVLVAQGLAQRSAVLLLDEPLTGLDVTSRQVILEMLDEEKSAGRTTVTSTHNFQDARRCDLVLLLATRAIAFGPPDVVLTEDNLREAFGGRFVRIGDTLLLDTPLIRQIAPPSVRKGETVTLVGDFLSIVEDCAHLDPTPDFCLHPGAAEEIADEATPTR